MPPSATVSVKEKDYLEQDKPIRGQKYACVSFISPEDVLKRKDVFLFGEFNKSYSEEITELFDNLEKYFNTIEISEEHKTRTTQMLQCVKERHSHMFNADDLQEEFRHFKNKNSEKLETQFHEENDYQTSIRGFKIRGVYESLKEAMKRAQTIRNFDSNFHVFVAEVGCWCPWSPNPDDINDVEYAETQLNTLMKNYKEELEKKDEIYNARFKKYLEECSATSSKDGTTPPIQIVQEAEAPPAIATSTVVSEEAEAPVATTVSEIQPEPATALPEVVATTVA